MVREFLPSCYDQRAVQYLALDNQNMEPNSFLWDRIFRYFGILSAKYGNLVETDNGIGLLELSLLSSSNKANEFEVTYICRHSTT